MRRRSFLLAVTVFLAGRVRAQGDEMAEVETAARRFARLRSYSFRLSYAVDGIPLVRSRYVADGRWERGIAYVSAASRNGRVEVYAIRERTVFRRPGGQWETGATDDRGRVQTRRRAMGLPDQDLDDVQAKFKSMRRSERSEVIDSRVCTEYSGDLTDQAVRAITRHLAFRVEASTAQATARIWIAGDGIIRKYTLEGTPRVVFLGLPFTVRVSKTGEIGDIDAVEVKPPATVMRLLDAAR